MAVANQANAKQEKGKRNTDGCVTPARGKSDTWPNHVVANTVDPPGHSLPLGFQDTARPRPAFAQVRRKYPEGLDDGYQQHADDHDGYGASDITECTAG